MIVTDLFESTPAQGVTKGRQVFSESRHNKLLKEDATYRKFHNLSRLLAERRMSEKEILDLFAAVEPGAIGRGLNWLDKTTGKVGGYLSKQAQNFTRKVTAAKLKTEWEQLGHFTDSDEIAAFLTKQGVPQGVVTDVYGKMGIPYTAAAAPTPAAAPAYLSKQFSAQVPNPATGKPWTQAELAAQAAPAATNATATTATATKRTGGKIPGQVSMTPNAIRKREARASGATATTAATAPNPFGQMANQLQNYGTSTGGRVTGTATGLKHTANPNNPNAISATAAAPAAIPAAATTSTATAAATPVAKPNFAQQNAGYKSVNYAPNVKTGASMPKPLGAPIAAAPTVTKVTSGGPTSDKKAKLAQRIAQAVKEPVAEMLQMVETKEDVQKIKQFVDQTFVRYGAVNESAFVVRNQILEHVTQVGAQRRRDFAAQQAH